MNGDFYVGQSIRLSDRKNVHFSHLRLNQHKNCHLQNAFNLYGEENFIFKIILYCEPEELTYYEQKLVDLWNPKYNICKECVDSRRGIKLSNDSLQKITEAQRKRLPITYLRPKNEFIFDELNWAKEVLENKISFYMSRKELEILAKYFKFLGQEDNEIKNNLISFCDGCGLEYDKKIIEKRLVLAVKSTKDFLLRIPININITKAEIKSIKSIKNHKYQKILFSMLVVEKYIKYTNTKYDLRKNIIRNNEFFIDMNFVDIFKISKTRTNENDKRKILSSMIDLGLIIDNGYNKFKVLFIDEKSPIEIVITDIDNLIDFYPFFCENCGEKIERTGKRQRYCQDCYRIIDSKNSKYRQRKMREKEWYASCNGQDVPFVK